MHVIPFPKLLRVSLRGSLLGFLLISLVAHTTVGWVLQGVEPATVESGAGRPLPPALAFTTFERGPAEVAAEASRSSPDAPRATPGGSRSWDNLSSGRGGRGGDARGAVEFTFLVSHTDPVNLQDGLSNARRDSQVQRIRNARDRASWENRRATPNPGDDPFLASGTGRLRQRVTLARNEAASGSRRERGEASAASAASGDLAARGAAAREPALAAEARRDSAGGGTPDGRGARRDGRSNVAHGRPPVDQGPAATLAREAGRVRDDTNAERLASNLLGSWVEASRRAGPETGEGVGGAGGGGAAGGGGSEGAGGLARANGGGRGDGFVPSGRRYRTWFLRQRRRVAERLTFPRARQLARDQGVTVLRVRVRRDGTLAGAIHTLRSSGFADLDRAARAALEASLPFEALPADIAPGRDELRLNIDVEFENPMFR